MERMIRNIEQDLSLGKIAFSAWGVNPDVFQPVIAVNFIGPDHRLPLPSPDGDWYIMQTAVPVVGQNEVVLCNTLISGLEEYYRNIGLVPESGIIRQVDPHINGRLSFGYPVTDPMVNMGRRNQFFISENGYRGQVLIPSFMSPQIRLNALRVNLHTLPMPDSIITNNKAAFRLNSHRFGYTILPGFTIEDGDQLQNIPDGVSDYQTGAWVKLPTGSGGDLVLFVDRINRDTLINASFYLRNAVGRSFEQGEFDVNLEQFWPQDRLSPKGFPLVVEADARNFGRIILNASSQFIAKNNQTEILAHAAQVTTDNGEYLGSAVIDESDLGNLVDLRLLEQEISKVARYNKEANGFVGLQGIDWFLIENQAGLRRPFIVELNSRPIVSTMPVIISRRLGYSRWLNINCYTDIPITNFRDYENLVGRVLAYGHDERGIVIPQSFRTLVSAEDILPSPNFKVLLLTNSQTNLDRIREELIGRGIRFRP